MFYVTAHLYGLQEGGQTVIPSIKAMRRRTRGFYGGFGPFQGTETNPELQLFGYICVSICLGA